MNPWWATKEWPCVCNRGDHIVHTHYEDWLTADGLHHCARCSSCSGYRPDIPEHIAIRILIGPEMTNAQAADILLGAASLDEETPAPTRESLLADRNDARLLRELRAYLNTVTITSDTIGDIRRSLFLPWEGHWNGWVREETASRENK